MHMDREFDRNFGKVVKGGIAMMALVVAIQVGALAGVVWLVVVLLRYFGVIG